MTMHIHHLTGCAPEPLAHYLKALGILRLVAEQKDETARLAWRSDHAVLATRLDKDELLHFFTNEYVPSPIIAPWNGGSGFFPSDNRQALDTILASSTPRLASYRETITLAQGILNGLKKRPEKEDKARLITHLRAQAQGTARNWIDAAIVISEDRDPKYPSLLGTGGNDGRLDFTNNFMQRITEVMGLAAKANMAQVRLTLNHALFQAEPAQVMTRNAIGQFMPGFAGGANNTTGYLGESRFNTWDFILALEGVLLFTAALARRTQNQVLPHAAAPFALRSEHAGYATATEGEKAPRGEQWLPLWHGGATLPDLQALFAEGRIEIRGHIVRNSMDAARAVVRLGTARGVDEFARLAFLERNGQANLAIPLTRWRVVPQPHRNAIDQVSFWLDRLKSKVSRENTPSAWRRASRRCEEALLSVCREGHSDNWQSLLLAIGAAEQTIARAPGQAADANLSPLGRLPSTFIKLLKPTSELRLALAIANGVVNAGSTQGRYGDSIRIYFLPLEQEKDGRWNTRKFAKSCGPNVIATTGIYIKDTTALIRRMLATSTHRGRFPVTAGHGHYAALPDVAALLRGALDEELIMALARPLMALDWQNAPRLPHPRLDADDFGILGLYGLFRLAHAPDPIHLNGTDIAVRTDASIAGRLLAADAAKAVDLAVRRLTVSGLRPFVRKGVMDSTLSRRIAAALAFPVAPSDLTRLADRLCRSPLPETQTEATLTVA